MTISSWTFRNLNVELADNADFVRQTGSFPIDSVLFENIQLVPISGDPAGSLFARNAGVSQKSKLITLRNIYTPLCVRLIEADSSRFANTLVLDNVTAVISDENVGYFGTIDIPFLFIFLIKKINSMNINAVDNFIGINVFFNSFK